MEPLWLMWGGVGIAFVGFMCTWTDRSFGLVQLLNQELFETVGRWVMRVGIAVAGVGAGAHILVG